MSAKVESKSPAAKVEAPKSSAAAGFTSIPELKLEGIRLIAKSEGKKRKIENPKVAAANVEMEQELRKIDQMRAIEAYMKRRKDRLGF
jgi:hypothetical protein